MRKLFFFLPAVLRDSRAEQSEAALGAAEGVNAEALQRGACDNTDIYRLMYLTLFGRAPGADR